MTRPRKPPPKVRAISRVYRGAVRGFPAEVRLSVPPDGSPNMVTAVAYEQPPKGSKRQFGDRVASTTYRIAESIHRRAPVDLAVERLSREIAKVRPIQHAPTTSSAFEEWQTSERTKRAAAAAAPKLKLTDAQLATAIKRASSVYDRAERDLEKHLQAADVAVDWTDAETHEWTVRLEDLRHRVHKTHDALDRLTAEAIDRDDVFTRPNPPPNAKDILRRAHKARVRTFDTWADLVRACQIEQSGGPKVSLRLVQRYESAVAKLGGTPRSMFDAYQAARKLGPPTTQDNPRGTKPGPQSPRYDSRTSASHVHWCLWRNGDDGSGNRSDSDKVRLVRGHGRRALGTLCGCSGKVLEARLRELASSVRQVHAGHFGGVGAVWEIDRPRGTMPPTTTKKIALLEITYKGAVARASYVIGDKDSRNRAVDRACKRLGCKVSDRAVTMVDPVQPEKKKAKATKPNPPPKRKVTEEPKLDGADWYMTRPAGPYFKIVTAGSPHDRDDRRNRWSTYLTADKAIKVAQPLVGSNTCGVARVVKFDNWQKCQAADISNYSDLGGVSIWSS